MVLAKVNAEVDSGLAKQFSVMGYPTFILLDQNGAEIDRLAGYLEVDEFIQLMRDYREGKGTLKSLLAQAATDTGRTLAYQIAEKFRDKGASGDAESWFAKVIAAAPRDSLSGESRVAIADMWRRKKDYDKAMKSFTSIAREFKGTPFEETANIYKAIVYRQMGDTTKAIKAFENFIKNFPNSEDVEYATKQIDKLRATPAVKP